MKKVVIITILIVGIAAALLFLRDGDALLFKNDAAVIDARKSADGTVTVSYTADTVARLKAQVTQVGGRTQNYDIPGGGARTVLPLHGGSGKYIVRVCVNVGGSEYEVAFYAAFDAECGEVKPFLAQNQMVNWRRGGAVEAAVKALAHGVEQHSELARIFSQYVADAIGYEVSDAVTSGYIPNADVSLDSGSGVCTDYAAALCAMLRHEGVPAKLVVGWAGDVYHAWVSAYYDGGWSLLDPTFLSSADGRQSVLDFVADELNYSVVYEY